MARSHACDFCGSPASVHVMHEIGRPGSARHFCMRCADRYDRGETCEGPLRHGAFLIGSGLCLLAVCLSCDWLPIGRARALDGWQLAALVFALVILSAGGVTRSSTLLGPGLILLLLAVSRDYISSGQPGFGDGQIAGLVVACAMVTAGLAVGRLSRRRTSADLAPGGFNQGPAGPPDRQQKGNSIHA